MTDDRDILLGELMAEAVAALRERRFDAVDTIVDRAGDDRQELLDMIELTLALHGPAEPSPALVDELAHTNVPGSVHEKRWQDVEALLEAGIEVVTTVNVQHLESLNDVTEQVTGVRQRETVPDHVVRAADQIELVDMKIGRAHV